MYAIRYPGTRLAVTRTKTKTESEYLKSKLNFYLFWRTGLGMRLPVSVHMWNPNHSQISWYSSFILGTFIRSFCDLMHSSLISFDLILDPNPKNKFVGQEYRISSCSFVCLSHFSFPSFASCNVVVKLCLVFLFVVVGELTGTKKSLIRPNKCRNTSSVCPKLGKVFYHGGVGTERKREWRNVRVVGSNRREDRMRPILMPCAFALKFWYLWCVLEHGFVKIIVLRNISPKLMVKELLLLFFLSLGVARPFLLTFWA